VCWGDQLHPGGRSVPDGVPRRGVRGDDDVDERFKENFKGGSLSKKQSPSI